MESKQIIQKTLEGAGWVTLLEVFSRTAGLISFVILARLLTPEDFGLVAIPLTVVGLLEMASAVGLNRAFIQKEGDVSQYFNAAWTFWILRSVGLFLLMWFTAPLAASFFKQPYATTLIRAVGFSILINGLGNPATILLGKQLRYKEGAIINGSGQIASFLTSTVWAIVAPSIWALIAGVLVRDLIIVITGYLVVPYGPRLTTQLKPLKPFMAFSLWNTGINWVQHLINTVDIAIVGRILEPASLGFYSRGRNLGYFPYQSGRQVLFKVAFPAYSLLQNQKDKMQSAFRKSTDLFLIFMLPVLMISLFLGDFLIPFFFGSQWNPMIRPFQLLLIAGTLRGLIELTTPIFQATGKPKIHLQLNMLFLIIGTFFSLLLIRPYGIIGVSISMLIAASLVFFASCLQIQKVLSLPKKSWGQSFGLTGSSALLTSLFILIGESWIPHNTLPLVCFWAVLISTSFLGFLFLQTKLFSDHPLQSFAILKQLRNV